LEKILEKKIFEAESNISIPAINIEKNQDELKNILTKINNSKNK